MAKLQKDRSWKKAAEVQKSKKEQISAGMRPAENGPEFEKEGFQAFLSNNPQCSQKSYQRLKNAYRNTRGPDNLPSVAPNFGYSTMHSENTK